MTNKPTTHGIHHVTAVTAQALKNKIFYTEVLGLRLVKKTVNQDDISAYHLFYADALGTPGTDMTFFDWEQAGPKKISSDEISRTYFRVKSESAISYWQHRLSEKGVQNNVSEINGRIALFFEDPEGQRLALVDDDGVSFDGKSWETKDISSEYAIRGFYAVLLSIPNLESIEYILLNVLNWEKKNTYIDPQTKKPVVVFAMDGGGPGKEVHIQSIPNLPVYGSTAGSVHHVAFRVKDNSEINDWLERLEKMNVLNSGIVERFYFKSLYFRISNGILFEIATDGPGFTVDEDMDHLGETLSLPPFLESQREKIESNLKPLN